MAAHHRLLASAKLFATAALRAAPLEESRSHAADALEGNGQLLLGRVALMMGDTVRAAAAFQATARVPLSAAARLAAQVLLAVATARHDTAQQLIASTLVYLETGDNYAEKAAQYAALETLYPQFVAAHGTPPDVVPGVLEGATSGLLDGFLDRQFTVLYERAFPVTRATNSGASRRTIVVEYLTGIQCTGCWNEDRAFHALSRHYTPDQVVTLGYHGNYPIANYADSTWARFNAWYPDPLTNGFPFRGNRSSFLPVSSVLGPNGEMLSGAAWINGRRQPGLDYQSRAAAPPRYYQGAVTFIDSVLRLPPEAVMRVDAVRQGDSVAVTVQVDSLSGYHRLLGLRIVMFEDTVRIHGASIRRLYQNVVRAESQTSTMALGLPLRSDGPSNVRYTFDLSRVEAQLAATHDPVLHATDETGRVDTSYVRWLRDYFAGFPDARDWQMDRTRLSIVAFVQDLETGEILQARRIAL